MLELVICTAFVGFLAASAAIATWMKIDSLRFERRIRRRLAQKGGSL